MKMQVERDYLATSTRYIIDVPDTDYMIQLDALDRRVLAQPVNTNPAYALADVLQNLQILAFRRAQKVEHDQGIVGGAAIP